MRWAVEVSHNSETIIPNVVKLQNNTLCTKRVTRNILLKAEKRPEISRKKAINSRKCDAWE